MPMHMSPTIDTDPGRIATTFPQISPIARSLPPATQSDIVGILQREQDRAVALLSSSPLLATLFVYYANQAAALESVTPSTETEEWKALENIISTLRREIDELKPENLKIVEILEAATASLEAFRSQVATFKVDTARRQGVDFLRTEPRGSGDGCGSLAEDSNAERGTFRSRISDLEAQRTELKNKIVQQQFEISKLQRQGSCSFFNAAMAETIDSRKVDESENRRRALRGELQREEREQEMIGREQEIVEREQGIVEREQKEKDKRETKEDTHREVRRRGGQKPPAPAVPPVRGSAIGKNNDHTTATPSHSQNEQKDVWNDFQGVGSTKEDEPSGLPSIANSTVPGSIFGTGKIKSFAKAHLPCTPVMKKSEDFDTITSPSAPATPIIPARVPAPPENVRLPDRGHRPPSSEFPYPSHTPEVVSETFPKSTSELLETPKNVMERVPTAPKRWPPLSPPPTQPQVAIPAPPPAETESEKLPSPRQRRRLSPVTSDGGSCRWKVGTIAMPTLTESGDRRSIPTDVARDEQRVNQRENLVEGLPGSNQSLRRNDSVRPQIATKPAPKPTPAGVKGSGQGSWRASLPNNLATVVADRSPITNPPLATPNIEDPPRWFAPNRPPLSQPTGFYAINKSAWGGAVDDTCGVAKGKSRDTTWGGRPDSTFCSGTSKSLRVDTMGKPLDSDPTTAGPENTPGSAVEIRNVSGWLGGSNEGGSGVLSPIKETKVSAKEGTATSDEDVEFVLVNAGERNGSG